MSVLACEVVVVVHWHDGCAACSKDKSWKDKRINDDHPCSTFLLDILVKDKEKEQFADASNQKLEVDPTCRYGLLVRADAGGEVREFNADLSDGEESEAG